MFTNMLLLVGCDDSKKPWDDALAAMKSGDTDAALILFETLPDSYREKELYITSIDAIYAYNREDWLDAVTLFDRLCFEMAYDLDMKRSDYTEKQEQVLFETLFWPLCRQFNISQQFSISQQHVITRENNTSDIINISDETIKTILNYDTTSPFRTTNPCINGLVALYGDLFQDSLFHYYNEQIRFGNDILNLSEYPYKNVYWGKSFRPKLTWDFLYNIRIDNLEKSITEQGLDEYFSKTDGSISPVDINSNLLYINRSNSPANTEYRQGSSWYKILWSYIPPFYLAEHPEEVRYVLNLSESHTYYGTYNNGSIGYSTETLVTIKDTKTGELLFSTYYSQEPLNSFEVPETATISTEIYGSSDFRKEIEDDILPVLERIIPIYYH